LRTEQIGDKTRKTQIGVRIVRAGRHSPQIPSLAQIDACKTV
jgi:hypothetical protein